MTHNVTDLSRNGTLIPLIKILSPNETKSNLQAKTPLLFHFKLVLSCILQADTRKSLFKRECASFNPG